MRPVLLGRPIGVYAGVDPGGDGAVAVVERYAKREGVDGLRLLRVAFMRASQPGHPAVVAAETVRAAVGADFVAGAAVEWPGLRPGQSGGDRLAVSAGAAMGCLLAGELRIVATPRPEEWLADLACLAASPGDDLGQLHIARLLDSVPGADGHLTPPRGRVLHDGAADAALLALWAAGVRGPGASSPRWRLEVDEEVHVVAPDGERQPFVVAVRREKPTKAALKSVAARGRWAGERGWAVASPSAHRWLAGLGEVGADAREAWGV